LKSETLAIDSSHILIELILFENNTPIKKPKKVPTNPIEEPQIKKILITENLLMPRVRKSAMFLFLSFTNMIMLEMMLKAATKMIRVKIKNI
jgi:hypothetical protein